MDIQREYCASVADSWMAHCEIVRIHYNSEGRSCESHEFCGKHVNVSDVVRFRWTVGSDSMESAIKVIRIVDNTECCIVDFFSRSVLKYNKDKYEDQYGKVVELYENSTNATKRNKSTRNNGMALCLLLNEIPAIL